MAEEIREEFDTMCNFSKGFFQDGVDVGVKQGKAEGRAERINIGIQRELECVDTIWSNWKYKQSEWTRER